MKTFWADFDVNCNLTGVLKQLDEAVILVWVVLLHYSMTYTKETWLNSCYRVKPSRFTVNNTVKPKEQERQILPLIRRLQRRKRSLGNRGFFTLSGFYILGEAFI